MSRPLRIAILAHSTNPRGGVAHALSVAEALGELGHAAVVHAPDAGNRGFYRSARCATVCVPASTASGPGLRDLVEARIADYVRYFRHSPNRCFDVFHAQDGISANALATLRDRGLIGGFAYTVHHVDRFADPAVDALQERAIRAADQHFTVSRLWQARLLAEHRRTSTVVGNGVDRAVFHPQPDGREAALRRRLGLGDGPVFLGLGGVEARKNALGLLQAFARLLATRLDARLVIAGGASLLDHGAYRARFGAELVGMGPAAAARVVLAGPIPQAEMPTLYRIADALAFPSRDEGFGLAAIEAIACGTPAIVSRIPPFTEHFGDEDVAWCDPSDPASIAEAMRAVLEPAARARLRARAEGALAPHAWRLVAQAHLSVYARLREAAYA